MISCPTSSSGESEGEETELHIASHPDHTKIAQALIPRMTDDEMPSRLTLGLDEDGNFTYSFE